MFPAVSPSARTGFVLGAGITENREAGNTARSHTHRSPESVAKGAGLWSPRRCQCSSGRAGTRRNAATPGCRVRAIIYPGLAGRRLSCHRPWPSGYRSRLALSMGFLPKEVSAFHLQLFLGAWALQTCLLQMILWPGRGGTHGRPQSQARPCWGHGGGQAPLPDSGDTRLGWQEPAQAGCSVCFRTKAVIQAGP